MNDDATASTGTAQHPAGIRECLVVTAGLLALIACHFVLVSLILNQPWHYPWTKPFWLDEFHTLMLAGVPSVGEQLEKLAQGGDYNPPALLLLLDAWSALTGPPTEATLRLFSSLVTLAALVGVYRLLRESFVPPVAFVAVAWVWASAPGLAEQAFTARFYALWLAGSVWLCNALVLLERHRSWWFAWVLTAVLAALVCTVHYFGVFALGLIAGFHLTAYHRRAGSLRTAAVLAVGPLLLLSCIPFYLGQKAVLGGQTWVKETNLGDAFAFARESAVWPLLTFVVAAAFFETLLPRRDETSPAPLETRPQAGAFALLFLPGVVIAFSFLGQPALVARYAFPFFVGLAPVVALLLSRLREALLAWLFGLVALVGVAAAVPAFTVPQDLDVLALVSRVARRVPEGATRILPDRFTAYPVWRYSGRSGPVVIVFRESVDRPRALVAVETKVAARMAALFPDLPRAVGVEALRGRGTALLIESLPTEELRKLYHGFRLQQLARQGALTAYLIEPDRGDENGR